MIRRLFFSVPWRRVPAVASAWGVAGLGIAVDHGNGAGVFIAAFLSGGLALFAASRPTSTGRAAWWGLAVVLASIGSAGGRSTLDVCAGVGTFFGVVSACYACSRILPDGGVVRTERRSPTLAVALVAVAWSMAFAAWISPAPTLSNELIATWVHAWGAGATLVSAAVLVGSVEVERRRRRLELGAAERTRAMRGIFIALAVAVCLLGVLSRVPTGAWVRLGLAVASVCATGAASHPDAVVVAVRVRRTVAMAVTGGAVALVGAAATSGRADAWIVTVATAGVALAVGSAARVLESPFQPAEGVWLTAFARASDEALRADPDEAIRETLLALRGPVRLEAPGPELWTFAPNQRIAIDAAGYVHEGEAELPEGLLTIASGEPEAALRTEVLEALAVRRPDLRLLGRWMTARGAVVAIVVASEGEIEGRAEGLLVLPVGGRKEPLTLEEVRAARRAANRLAAPCRARSTGRRAMVRAEQAKVLAEAAEERADKLQHEGLLEAGRHALAAARLARPAAVGRYSAASRMAMDALERCASMGAPLVLVAPSAVDPVPYVARAHLAGLHGGGPLVLVDGASSDEHDLPRWSDKSSSPLALCGGGLLVLLDGAALPLAVQHLVARTYAERRVPWDRAERFEARLAFATTVMPEELLASGRLHPALAARLGDGCERPIVLPRLQDRPEDLRSLVTDRLAREGMRLLGRPVGIEPAAYARLANYDFPGDCRELEILIERLVAGCQRDLVRASDVDDLRLWAEPPPLNHPSARSGGSGRSGPKKDPLSA